VQVQTRTLFTLAKNITNKVHQKRQRFQLTVDASGVVFSPSAASAAIRQHINVKQSLFASL